jgi:hypothetical protein
VILPPPPARQSTLSWLHFRRPNRPSTPKAFSELLVKRIQLFDSAPLLPKPPTSSYTKISPRFPIHHPGRLESGAAFLLSSSSRPFCDSFLPFKQVVVVIILVVRISHLIKSLPFPKASRLSQSSSSTVRSLQSSARLPTTVSCNCRILFTRITYKGNSLTCRTSTLHRIISLSFVGFRVESGLLIVRVTQGRANFSAAYSTRCLSFFAVIWEFFSACISASFQIDQCLLAVIFQSPTYFSPSRFAFPPDLNNF